MRILLLMVSLTFLGTPAIATDPRGTTIVEYYGPHPIDPGVNGGLCTIQGAHMHSYRPQDEVLYVNDGPYWTFVGDPTEFEPEAPAAHSYYGHHPVWWTNAPGEHYCYITGPHHHGYAPAGRDKFVERGGAYWFVGAQPVWYERRKRKHDMDGHYGRHAIVRPIITVEPPTGWIGVRLGIGGAALGIEFGAPVVVLPSPVIFVDDDHHHRPKWKKHKDDHHYRGKDKHKGHGKGHGKGKHK